MIGRQLTSEQMRAARAMLRLNQRQFAEVLHLAVSTVRRLERTPGQVRVPAGVAEQLRTALAELGVELIDSGPYNGIGGPGVRLIGEPVFVSDDSAREIGDEKEPPDAVPVPA